MIDGLIAGKVQGQPMRKTGKTGKAYVTAKVRAHAGDSDVFVNVICFSDSTGAALLALGDGDAVSLAGALKPGAWLDKEGAPRPSLDMVASAVLTVYHIAKKRKTMAGDDVRPAGDKPGNAAWKPRELTPDHSGLDDGEPLDF